MIQFNLLPAVKVDYIKAKRTKRTVMLGAAGTITASVLALLFLCLVVFVWQQLRLNNLDTKIKTAAADIKNRPDIDKILTIQNQLKSIDALHEAKPEVSRIFTYLAQVTPSTSTIQSFSIDFDAAAPVISFSGQSPSIEEINKFVDTLKFTTISRSPEDTSETRAFSQVVLSSFGRDDKGASYSITLKYDPSIFSSQEKDIKLVVPKITSTRSTTERPNILFQENKTPLGETKP